MFGQTPATVLTKIWSSLGPFIRPVRGAGVIKKSFSFLLGRLIFDRRAAFFGLSLVSSRVISLIQWQFLGSFPEITMFRTFRALGSSLWNHEPRVHPQSGSCTYIIYLLTV